ncbi:hypothetical protein PLESTM_000558700 [Pleodorina starrii]|nr:hypothetical protein PLESTM_000558700 [Pleodorina starrii]
MGVLLLSSALQAHLVLALAGVSSAYIAIARPTLSRRKAHTHTHTHTSPPATLLEAGTSPALSATRLAALRAGLAVYIFAMGATQLSRLGPYVFKFYTIWNWWLLGLYFALAAAASVLCARQEAAAAEAEAEAEAEALRARKEAAEATAEAPAGAEDAAGQAAVVAAPPPAATPAAPLLRATPLSRACHALFLINSSTVIIVDAVCWGVLYPMLARGPQTPEIERIVRRLLLTFTSYNQHGLNAVYIYTDLFLNRHRLAFHAVGPLGLWSLSFGLWALAWHAKTGK